MRKTDAWELIKRIKPPEVTTLVEMGEAEDEEVARETGLEVKFVRKALEGLYENGIVGRLRDVDGQTGWISYRWRLEPSGLLRHLAERKRESLEEIRKRLERESETVFFTCEERCTRVDFDEAVDLKFECLECGGALRNPDSGDLSPLKEREERLERDLEILEETREALQK